MGGWLYLLGRRRALSSIPIADHHHLSPPTHNARPLTTPAMPATAHVFPPCCLSSQQRSSPHLFLSHHHPPRTQLPVCAIPPGTPALPPSLASPHFALPPRLRRSGYRPAQHRDFRHPRDEAGRVPEESTGLPAQQDARGRTEPASAHRRPGAHRPAATRAAQAAGRGPSCCAAQPARDLLIDRVPTTAPDAGWCAPHLARRLAHKPVQVPGVDSPDPWRREGALPRSEDQGQHTKVLAHPPGCSAHSQL